jgi:hypothetical protein
MWEYRIGLVRALGACQNEFRILICVGGFRDSMLTVSISSVVHVVLSKKVIEVELFKTFASFNSTSVSLLL